MILIKERGFKMNIYNKKDLQLMADGEEIDDFEQGFMLGFLDAFKEQ